METKIIENIGNNLSTLRDSKFPVETIMAELGIIQIDSIEELKGMLKILSVILDYDMIKDIKEGDVIL